MTTKNIISGAAIGTLIGTLAAFIYPRRQEIVDNIRDQSEKARGLGEALLRKGDFRRVEYRDNYWKGGLLGLLVGAGTALLMAPKSGKQFRGQLTRAYNDLSEKSEELIHQFQKNSHYPFARSHASHLANHVKKKKPVVRASSRAKK